MKKNSRIYAAIHLDALEQNLENMKKNLTPGTKMIGVIKANAYGHGAVRGTSYGRKRLHLGVCGS